jgi:hypothetical protein
MIDVSNNNCLVHRLFCFLSAKLLDVTFIVKYRHDFYVVIFVHFFRSFIFRRLTERLEVHATFIVVSVGCITDIPLEDVVPHIFIVIREGEATGRRLKLEKLVSNFFPFHAFREKNVLIVISEKCHQQIMSRCVSSKSFQSVHEGAFHLEESLCQRWSITASFINLSIIQKSSRGIP